jgi:hypothetical protein
MNAGRPTPATEADERLASLHDAYVEKVSAAVTAGRDDLVHEFAAAFEREAAELTGASAGARRLERRPTRWGLRARTGATTPAGNRTSRTRETLRRFDRYTLEVMNPGHPYRSRPDRSA